MRKKKLVMLPLLPDVIQKTAIALDEKGNIKIDKYGNIINELTLLEAEKLLLQACEIAEESKLSDNVFLKINDLAQKYKNLANHYFKINHRDCEKYYEKALMLYKKLPIPPYNEIFILCSNLSVLANKNKNYLGAVKFADASLEIIKKVSLPEEKKSSLSKKILFNKVTGLLEYARTVDNEEEKEKYLEAASKVIDKINHIKDFPPDLRVKLMEKYNKLVAPSASFTKPLR